MRVSLEPAYVLHTRFFRDTSQIVELFTLQYGRVAVLARGVRQVRGRSRLAVTPFAPLIVSWSGAGELPTLTKCEANGLAFDLAGNALASGFYLNELLMRLLQRHDPHQQTFAAYQVALNSLQFPDQHYVGLRLFEKKLLVDLGYGLQLQQTASGEPINVATNYAYEFGVGFTALSLAINHSAENIFSGSSILELHAENFTSITSVREAKRLLQSALTRLLGNKPIKSRELLLV